MQEMNGTVLVLLVHLLHCSLACLLSFCGSAVVCRITLSFPTARSIFYIFLLSLSYKIVPCSHRENAFDRSGILSLIAVLLIVEGNVIAVLGRATAACKLRNIFIFLLMFSYCFHFSLIAATST